MRAFPFFLWLCRQPVRRVPTVSPKWNNNKTQNMPSFMMQACGDVLLSHQACEKCAGRKGPYNECVVINDPQIAEHTRGSCANCWYGKQGSMCTLRTGVGNTSNVAPISPPPPPPAATAPGPQIHPSYAAALQGASTATASPAPAAALHPRFAAILERNKPSPDHPPTQVPAPSTSQQQPSQEQPSLSPALSSLATSAAIRTNLVQLWENRYRNMTPEKLIEAYEHIQEMQEDLNTRNQAIHRVILSGLRDALNAKKGQPPK
ncbi:hypothetical protein B0T21DRAFT_89353 [Apiosordaria backusii]|uniref:Uncharacterized protein n=1 Tax=Apiosordaria backusii TaxID=314023 RepID=A0AA40ESB2_9PEZI|nr:hypothetical protein B0T21DRAFT_89353 [Apiosordaria backusii]